MAKYIKLGIFNKHYLYIIFCIFALILKDVIYGYNYNESFSSPFSHDAQENFSEFNLIKHMYCYLVTIILSLILLKYKTKKVQSEASKIKPLNISASSNKTDGEILDISNSDSEIAYIVKDEKEINAINAYSKKFLYFIIFLWIIQEHLIEIFSVLKDLDFWMIEIIILSYLYSNIFKEQIYLHHKIIMIVNLLHIILKIISITFSFQDEYNKKGEDYEYQYPPGYEDTKLKNLYVHFVFLIPVGILIYLVLITLRSYVNSNLKVFMDKKNIDEFKLLLIYGSFGTVISIIVCLLTTFVDCGNKEEKDIYAYLCKVQYDDSDKKYFDSFKAYYYSFKENTTQKILIEILRNLIATLSFFMHKYCSIKIFEKFNPMYLIFSFPVYYFIQKIILIITTAIKEKSFFSKDQINYINFKFSLDISGDIFSIIGFLVYLEIIELHFCNLEFNLRRYIMKRADSKGKENEDEDEDKDENEGL